MTRLARILLCASLLLVACGDDSARAGDGSIADGETDGGASTSDADPDGRAPVPVDEADPSVDALDRLNAGSTGPLRISFSNGFPIALSTRFRVDGADHVARARSFIEAFPELYGQDSDRSRLEVRRSFSPPGPGLRDRVVFHQVFDGMEVHGAELSVVLEDSDVVGAFGRLISPRDPGFESPRDPGLHSPGDPSLESPRGIGLTGADAESLIRSREGLGSSPRDALPELVIADRAIFDSTVASAPKLAWRVGIAGSVFIVDAHDGALMWRESPEQESLDLTITRRDGGTDDDIEVADENGCYTDLSFLDSCTFDDRVILDGLHDAWVFYRGWFGWDSMDGDGMHLDVETNSDETTNARYLRTPFGEYLQFTDPYADPDVAGHELTHGVIHHTSDLDYEFESGALNESFADLFGNLIEGDVDERFEHPGTPDLLLRENVGGEDPIRSMCFPGDMGQPADFHDYMQLDDDVDNGGVHRNSGIANRAWCEFAKLVVGGDLNDLDLDARVHIATIAFEALQMLPSDATFAAAREAALLATLPGPDPTRPFGDWCLMARAWDDVGVSTNTTLTAAISAVCELPEYQDADGDFIDDADDNCDGLANPQQTDTNNDGQGDVCDPDNDGDGVLDGNDLCPFDADPANADTDGDGAGDACDDDEDGDGLANPVDNCPGDANADQQDSDDDGDGDACDPDIDGDDVWGSDDNCPFTTNADQVDADEDGLGDVCDPCPTGADDVTAWTMGLSDLGISPKPIVADSDGDGTSDGCDADPLTPTRVRVDGAVLTGSALLPGSPPRNITVTLDGGSAWIPLPTCRPPCDDSWNEDTLLTVELTGVPRGVGASLIDERGRPWASAVDRDDGGTTRTLRLRPRGGRRYRLVVRGPMPEVTVTLRSRSDSAPRSDASHACDGAPDRTLCPLLVGASFGDGVCIGGRCTAPRCGDGVRSGDEICDDGNMLAGDGCEPGTCLPSCSDDAGCTDANACDGAEVCSLGRCTDGMPAADDSACVTDAGGPGRCRSGRCAVPGCGDRALDMGEECDDGNMVSGDGCEGDCRFSCAADAACADTDPCNGSERCDTVMHRCMPGTPLDCDDTNACTTDSCAALGCGHTLVDGDGDGFAPASLGACGTDCDDTTRLASPALTEVCDGIDNDCDGTPDDGFIATCYADRDGDRFGQVGMSMPGCACPVGWVAAPSTGPFDCNDGRLDVFPANPAWYSTGLCPGGCAQPFDYDCSGADEARWTAMAATCTPSGGGCTGDGWGSIPGVPACGEPGRYQTCTRVRAICTGSFMTIPQECH